jgi:hypothetical protein
MKDVNNPSLELVMPQKNLKINNPVLQIVKSNTVAVQNLRKETENTKSRSTINTTTLNDAPYTIPTVPNMLPKL